MKELKKKLQKIFKLFFYKASLLFYGKIKGKINSQKDERIKTEIIHEKNNLKYKIYKIKNARLYTDRIHDTAIILDNFIVEGPSHQLRNVNNAEVEKNIVFYKGTPRIKKSLNGKVLSLLTGGGGNDNYFHWLYDVLPRLAICSKIIDLDKIDYFLLPSFNKKFQKETIELLNIPKKKCISSEKYRHINSSEIYVTEHPYVITNDASNDIQNMPIWISEWLKRYIQNTTGSNLSIPKKIYIDRSESSSNVKDLRLITNEKEIKNFLKKDGFQSVTLGNYHFKEQVEIFNNAEIIIGLHGAGFANLCFCKKDTKIIELKSTTDGKMYENLALTNGLKYKSITIEATKFKMAQFGHINVPIDTLNKTINNFS